MKKRITFEIKASYYFELLTPERKKWHGSTEEEDQ